jgi:hypothetical protein
MASFRIFVKLNSKPLNNFIFISSVKILLIIKIIYSNRGKVIDFSDVSFTPKYIIVGFFGF